MTENGTKSSTAVAPSNSRESVQVVVRCRPLNSKEEAAGHQKSVSCSAEVMLQIEMMRSDGFSCSIVHVDKKMGEISIKKVNSGDIEEPSRTWTYDDVFGAE